MDETEAYARRVAAGAALAIASIKHSVYQGSALSLRDGLALERKLIEPLFDSEDAREGLAAFVEKRTAVFRGK
jgi:enoyl-CoA hydratase/carnithine racemase